MARPIGCSDRALERRRQLQESRRSAYRVGVTPTTWSCPLVNVPVLSKATQRLTPQPLEMRAPFEQHALPRGGRQRGHDRDRRRDDQRAGTGNDEEHERAVDPVAPRPAEHQRRHEPNQDGQDQHSRRIDRANRSTNVWLGARWTAPLDEVDDARERRIAAQPRRPGSRARRGR